MKLMKSGLLLSALMAAAVFSSASAADKPFSVVRGKFKRA